MNKLEKALKKIRDAESILEQLAGEQKEPAVLPDLSGSYAVIWNYKEKGTKLCRAGLAKDFKDPRPATKLDEEGFSPFDDIMPWDGMQKRCISIPGQGSADVMVNIPEFYYFAFKDKANKRWIWAVSPDPKEGFKKHPGSGRLVGRYHTSESREGVWSRPGEKPLTKTNWNDFRKYSQSKGDCWGMIDLATWSAIQLLYLVEFADFDAQKCLGSGSKNETSWEPVKTGGTDGASYHTVKADGKANQYRRIEDPFSNVFDWIDGFAGSGEGCRISPEKGLNMEDMPETDIKLADDGWIKNFAYSDKALWAFIPSKSEGDPDHVGDYTWSWPDGLYPAYVGGGYYGYAAYGFFYFSADNSASNANGNLGSRLLKT